MKFFIGFLILCSTAAFSQEVKMEREWNIKFKELPVPIQEQLKPYRHKKNKMKCFQEQDGSHNSYEVKLRLNKEWFSIEFDTNSNLEDIELTISENQVNPSSLIQIKEHLNKYDRYVIDKIQKQFSSTTQTDKQIIEDALLSKVGDIERYEIEITAFSEGEWRSYEMLFDNNGTFLQQREIKNRPVDNVMY